MFSKLSVLIKSNLRPLVFVAIIAFSLFSYNIKQESDKKIATNLLAFLDNSFSNIDGTIKNLTTETLLYDNLASDYNKVISSLDNLSSRINNFKSNLPNETGEATYQKVRVSLIELYNITQDRLDLFRSIYKDRKGLIGATTNYVKLRNPEQISSNSELQLAFQEWDKINTIKKSELKQYDGTARKSYFENKLSNEDQILQTLKNNTQNQTGNLSQEVINSIIEINKSTTLEPFNTFFRLQNENIETPAFGEKVSELQNDVKEMKNTYNLRASQG